jgi:hypothetical protein
VCRMSMPTYEGTYARGNASVRTWLVVNSADIKAFAVGEESYPVLSALLSRLILTVSRRLTIALDRDWRGLRVAVGPPLEAGSSEGG